MYLQEREKSFDKDFGVRSKLPEYNALQDENMKRFFENSQIQRHLWMTGQIDKSGRVIDLEKNKSKIQTIEKEFLRAEKAEMRLMKDESDLQNSVKMKKLNCLEKSRRAERILQLKDERKTIQK